MTYWDDTKTSEKNPGSWMGVAVSLAHSIGLHPNPETYDMELPRQRMRKIVWWSLYTRDRVLALITRRPKQVNTDDCTVPLLTLYDFTLKPFPAEWVKLVGDNMLLQNIHQQRELILIFIERVKLCFNLGPVLSTQYTAFTDICDFALDTNAIMVLNDSDKQTCERHLFGQGLEGWLANIPIEAHYMPSNRAELGRVDGTLHSARALLRLLYLSALIALYRS
jgi:hypothetical protein